jgi:hypothetical protein
MDAENNLCEMENVGDKGEGAGPTKGGAEEDGASDAKHRNVQKLGPMGRGMDTGKEDATFRRENSQQVEGTGDGVGMGSLV